MDELTKSSKSNTAVCPRRLLIRNVSARRWVRSFNDPSPVNAALAGFFQCVSEDTYDCCVDSKGCPLTDMSLGAKPYGKPRLPFMLSPVVEGRATGAVGDDFVCVNSFCRSHDQGDRPEEGESTAAQSLLRVPNPLHDRKLGFEPGVEPPASARLSGPKRLDQSSHGPDEFACCVPAGHGSSLLSHSGRNQARNQ